MSVLEALADHYGRLRARGEAPPFGYARKRIGYAVVLSPAGESGAVIALSDGSAQSPSGHVCEVPHPVRRTSKPAANFLWDKPAYVFGVKRHASTRRLCPAEGEHRVFAALHESLLAHSDDEGLKALLGFIRAWDPQHYECLPHAQAMLDRNVVFRFAGDEQWLHERPASRAVWTEHLSRDRGTKRVCLVTGAQAPIARVHPSVKGVRGTHSAGAVLVTSNNETLESYGQIQGETASVSIEAAFAYTTALNALLAPDRRRRFQIGDMTLVFWAHTPGDAHAGLNAEALLFHAIAEGESAIAHTLESVARGEPLAPTTPPVPAATRFHLLGLAPNVGRLSVRLWHADTFGGFVRRLVEHWMDMRLEPAPWREPPSARRLLLETARKRRSELVPPALGAALLRAILTGGRYPRTLLVAVIARIRADKAVTGMQAAICRACLARDHRLGFEQENPPVSLDRDETHPAYRLGRLFAVYERVQRAALGTVNASIRDRFYGAASATPATVFPLLSRKCAHHLATLGRSDRRRRLGHWYEREIDAIVDGLGTGFPRTLRLEDQGRFALGYHHQRTWKRDTGQGPDDSPPAIDAPARPDP